MYFAALWSELLSKNPVSLFLIHPVHQNHVLLWKQEIVFETIIQTLSCKDRNTKPCFITEPLQDNRDHTAVAMISKIKYISVTNVLMFSEFTKRFIQQT